MAPLPERPCDAACDRPPLARPAEPLARASIDGSCAAYVGPDGAPYGYASVFFPLFLSTS